MCIRAETTSVTILKLGDSILFLRPCCRYFAWAFQCAKQTTSVCVGRSRSVGEASAEEESASVRMKPPIKVYL